jgi:hypothetical protein
VVLSFISSLTVEALGKFKTCSKIPSIMIESSDALEFPDQPGTQCFLLHICILNKLIWGVWFDNRYKIRGEKLA